MLLCVLFTGADPTIENANGHKAEMYTQSVETKKLFAEYEKKVQKHETL